MDRGKRLLRVGVLQGGQLVEERLVPERGVVTVGGSASDTFILPMMPGSRSCVLFGERAGGRELYLAPGWEGSVVLDEGQAPLTLSALRQSVGPRQRVTLGPAARGKLILGDTTILFQRVAAPEASPRPRLPSSVRGSLRGNLDWILIAVVGASVFTHAAFVVYLRSVDLPRRPDIEDVPVRVATATLHLWHPIPEVAVQPAAEKKRDPNEGKATATVHAPSRAGPTTTSDAERTAREEARRRADRIRMEGDVRTAVASVIGVRGVDAVIHDDLHAGDPAHDANKAFEGVRGTTTAQLRPGLHPKGYGAPPTKIKDTDLTPLAMNDVETGEKHERGIKGKIDLPPAPPKVTPDHPCSSGPIVDGIRQRKGGLVACYEKALHRDPTLSGKVRLHFSVNGSGRVSDVELEEDTVGDEQMADCITNNAHGWIFAHTESCGRMQFSYPFVFTPSR